MAATAVVRHRSSRRRDLVSRPDKENSSRYQLLRQADEQDFTRGILFVDPTHWIEPLANLFVELTNKFSPRGILFVDPTHWIEPLANFFVELTNKFSPRGILFVDPTHWIEPLANFFVRLTNKISRVESTSSIQPIGLDPLPTSSSG